MFRIVKRFKIRRAMERLSKLNMRDFKWPIVIDLIRNTQPPLFNLYGMAMFLNLESLDHGILQMKIRIFE